MKLHKRRKSSRFRGSKTHARGFKKKARGSGHQGGVGLAGTGKRGDAKKTLILNLFGNDYFGKDRALRRGHVKPKLKVMNLQFIQDHIMSLVKQGKAKENKGAFDLDLKGYKILGDGITTLHLNIKASAASQSAVEKVKAKGGSIVVEEETADEAKEQKDSKPAKESKK